MFGKVFRALFYDPSIVFWFLAIFIGALCVCLHVYEAFNFVFWIAVVILSLGIIATVLSYFKASLFEINRNIKDPVSVGIWMRRVSASILFLLAVILTFVPVYGLRVSFLWHGDGWILDKSRQWVGLVYRDNKPTRVVNGLGNLLDATSLWMAKLTRDNILWGKIDVRDLDRDVDFENNLSSVLGKSGKLVVTASLEFNQGKILQLLNSGKQIDVIGNFLASKIKKECDAFSIAIDNNSNVQIDLRSFEKTITDINDDFYIIKSVKAKIIFPDSDMEME